MILVNDEAMLLECIEKGHRLWAMHYGGPVGDINNWFFWFWNNGVLHTCDILTRRLIEAGKLKITKNSCGLHWVELNPEAVDD